MDLITLIQAIMVSMVTIQTLEVVVGCEPTNRVSSFKVVFFNTF